MSIDNKRSNCKLHICITIAVMVFIFVQSALPGKLSGAESNIIVQFIAGITGWDGKVLSLFVRKAAHFTEYLILGICLSGNMRDLREKNISDGAAAAEGAVSTDEPALNYLLAAWAAGTLYAMTDEFHQFFVPDRMCSFTDVCIDSAGVACGVLIYCLCTRKDPRKKRK